MIIYKTTNLINGKFYIGKDEKNNPNYFGSGKYLLRAISKYGKENFIKEIIDSAKTTEELNEKEIYWIEKTNAIKEGYNLTEGGSGGSTMKHATAEAITEWKRKIGDKSRGHKLSKESREKISEARKGIKFSKETREKIKAARAKQVITKEHKRKIGESNKGHTVTEETRRKISEATMGKNKGNTPPNKGVPMTNEQKEKLSKKLKGTREGDKNPAYGKKWITDGETLLFVNSEDLEQYFKLGYMLGKKLK